MAKKPIVKKKIQRQNGGRKPKPINWDDVDKFLVSGANGVQIAAYVGVCQDTLYIRCKEDKGVDFSVYLAEKRQKGNSLLLGKQYQVAMSGNVSMLIWLGKQRLEQSEQPKDTQEFNGSLSNLLDVMHMIKSAEDFDALVQMAKDNKKEVKPKVEVIER